MRRTTGYDEIEQVEVTGKIVEGLVDLGAHSREEKRYYNRDLKKIMHDMPLESMSSPSERVI